MKIGIIGGTGAEGGGLALRWAHSGHDIIIGSRTAQKAAAAAEELRQTSSDQSLSISGDSNLAAAAASELVVLSIPYAAQADTLEEIKAALDDKILLTVVVPLGKPPARFHPLPSGLSAAEEAQQQLGEAVRVVAAFQNISAHHLKDLDHKIDCDVLICGRKKADKELVAQLCQDAGMRGVNAGSLVNATLAEGLTSLLIGINIRHKIKNAGIRITGI